MSVLRSGRGEIRLAKTTERVPLEGEAKWIQLSQQGDKEAFRRLFEHYKDRVFVHVVSMVRKREIAEDLTQEIFVKAFFALRRFAGDSALYTWLFRIASNHCLDHLRKKQPDHVSLDLPIDEDGLINRGQTIEAPHRENPAEGYQEPSEIDDLLAELDPEQRLVLNLREFESYSYGEIAKTMNCGINTVKSRLNRAREAFKQAYRRKHGNIPTTEFVQQKEKKL